MITQEQIEVGGKTFLHTYSDKYYILQNETGIEYVDAMDTIPCKYTYSETTKEKEQWEREHPQPEPEQ